MVVLSDVATLLNGRAYKQSELLNGGKTPILSIGNFFSNKDWYYSDLELDENKYCDNGDLLFAWSGSFGPKIWNGGKVSFHYHIWKILLDNKLIKKYMYYFLYNSAEKIKAQGHGITMIHTTKGEMEKMLVPLPPINIQRQIADTLDKTQEIIDGHIKQLEGLDNFIKAVFYDMFGDPVTNDKNKKTIKLYQLIKNKSDLVDGPFGSSVNTKTDYIENGEIPVIRTKNISNNLEFVYDDLKFMTRKKYQTILRSQVLPNDIILTKVGTIGNVCVFPNTYKEAVLSTTGSCRIRPNTEVIYPEFLMYYLFFYKPKMLQIASAGVQAFLNMNHIKDFDIFFVDKKIQKRFLDIAKNIQEQKALVKKSFTESQYLFNSLMSKYFD